MQCYNCEKQNVQEQPEPSIIFSDDESSFEIEDDEVGAIINNLTIDDDEEPNNCQPPTQLPIQPPMEVIDLINDTDDSFIYNQEGYYNLADEVYMELPVIHGVESEAALDILIIDDSQSDVPIESSQAGIDEMTSIIIIDDDDDDESFNSLTCNDPNFHNVSRESERIMDFDDSFVIPCNQMDYCHLAQVEEPTSEIIIIEDSEPADDSMDSILNISISRENLDMVKAEFNSSYNDYIFREINLVDLELDISNICREFNSSQNDYIFRDINIIDLC